MFSWNDIAKPISGLAPMDGVTDFPMRQIQEEIAKPSVMYTEFINVEGFSRVPERFKNKIKITPNQRPIIVQLFGHTPEDFTKSCEILLKEKIDGIDINMGCPARTVVQHGGGASLIEDPKLAGKIIKACLKITSKNNIPLSVKTRIGINKPVTQKWIEFLAQFPIDCIAVHGRLLKNVHSGPVNWEEVSIGAEIVHKHDIVYLGNGGIKSIKEGESISEKYNLDGFLIGQAAMGNPWVFKKGYKPSNKEKLETLTKHAELAEKFYGKKGFMTVRKHLAWYCKGIENSKALRTKLVQANNAKDVEILIKSYLEG